MGGGSRRRSSRGKPKEKPKEKTKPKKVNWKKKSKSKKDESGSESESGSDSYSGDTDDTSGRSESPEQRLVKRFAFIPIPLVTSKLLALVLR